MIFFDVITIFPEILDSYLKESILARAEKKKLIKIKFHNLREYTDDRYQMTDDRPYGGGSGMVLKIEPIFKALKAIKLKAKNKKAKIILFSPRGKVLNQQTIDRYSRLDQLIMICGRYEGIDERVNKLVDEVVSVGDYILMGGELPAITVVESVSRLIPGVLGVLDELKNKSKARIKERKKELKEHIWGFTDFPQYTRPEVFSVDGKKKWRVPKELMTGNHKKIKEWREKHTKMRN
ncbi:tRNA (guanosine(37)-N1)-methyltransferase TrmD [Candidatus Azambacteria bacterium]|nr:tRNA (guanosine(37)-N1)-methyltransferase TrmD [Candidatus Azambacteria bacterium]